MRGNHSLKRLMILPSQIDAGSAATSAVKELLGGLFGWLLVCSLAGLIAAVAADGIPSEFDLLYVFSWIAHLGVAGICIWGLFVLCLHGLLVSALLHGHERPLHLLALAFLLQLTTSSIVEIMWEHSEWTRICLVWLTVGGLVGGCLLGSVTHDRKLQTTRVAALRARLGNRNPGSRSGENGCAQHRYVRKPLRQGRGEARSGENGCAQDRWVVRDHLRRSAAANRRGSAFPRGGSRRLY